MSSLIKSTFSLATLTMVLFSSHLYAEKASVSDSIKKCVTLLEKECKGSDFKNCRKKKDKLMASIYQCQDFLIQNASSVSKDDLGKLSEKIQKEVKDSGLVSEDQQKCSEVYQKVCSEMDRAECMKTKANQFPSFCRKLIPANSQSMVQMAGVKQEVAGACAESIQKSCKLEMPKHQEGKDNMKAYRAAMKKYQVCLNQSVKKSIACKKVVSKDKNSSGVTQLIE